MGYERFSSSAYSDYTRSTNLNSLRREQVFTSRGMPDNLNPAKIALRESCDSAANPNSTPIIFGLDVTGSMGFVAESIAKEGLQPLMEGIYNDLPVSDPHIMFMGIGDVDAYDRAPLQVSQFESGAVPLIEQLRTLFLESGGGGNNYESYDLPWYFAAHRTAIDSFNRRGKKGFLFTIGDEMPPPASGLDHGRLASKVFGTTNIPDAGSRDALLAEVQKKYKVFHIIAEEGSYARSRLGEVRGAWSELLGPNAIFMKDHRKLDLIVNATLKIANGADIYEVISASNDADTLRYAFSNALAQG